jgi:hypothetical protein
MRPFSIPAELWRDVRPERAPARPQPVLELPLPERRVPTQERCDDKDRGVIVIDLLGDD